MKNEKRMNGGLFMVHFYGLLKSRSPKKKNPWERNKKSGERTRGNIKS